MAIRAANRRPSSTTTSTHTLQVSVPVPLNGITPPRDVVAIHDVTLPRDVITIHDVTSARDVVVVAAMEAAADDASSAKLFQGQVEERTPGLKKSPLYKICQGAHAMNFLVFMLAFSMAYWRTYSTLSPQEQEELVKEEAEDGEWARVWERRVIMHEGLWRQCLRGVQEERFSCPPRVPESQLGLIIQVTEGLAMGLISLGLLLTICQVCCTALATYNVVAVSCSFVGGLVGAVGNGMFMVEQYKLEEAGRVHELALGWAFYASFATSVLFALTGFVLFLDEFYKPLQGFLAVLAKSPAEDGDGDSSSGGSGESGGGATAGASCGVGDGGGIARSSEYRGAKPGWGWMWSGRNCYCYDGHGGSGRGRVRGRDNPVFVEDDEIRDATVSSVAAAPAAAAAATDDSGETIIVTRL